MSADNFIGVRRIVPTPEKYHYEVVHGFMSPLDEDCMYDGSRIALAIDRATALVTAHDLAKQETILEYGVIELNPVPTKPCGKCFTCIHERKIVADDIMRCDKCKDPISLSDWAVLNREGTFHRTCEPR